MKKIQKNFQIVPQLWDGFLKSIERRKRKEGIPSLPISSVLAELIKEHIKKW